MSTTPPPTRVSADELARVERLGGKASIAYQRLAEQRAEYERWERVRDGEEARLRDEREARLAAAQQEREAERERERSAAMARLRAELRMRFLAANPEATDADWVRLEQRVVDDELLTRSRAGRGAEVEGLRQRGGYAL
jgi:hypothetical protein